MIHCNDDKILLNQKKIDINNVAFVTLLMINDNYLPGIILSGLMLKYLEPNIDRICMVTKDIKQETINTIKHIYIVKIVDYIEVDYKYIKISNIDVKKIYAKTFTKLNCFKLKYKKIVLYDADMIPLKNIKKLFSYPTPSMPLLAYFRLWGESKHKNFRFYKKYICSKFKNGQKITKDDIDYILNIKLMLKKKHKLSNKYFAHLFESTICVLEPSNDTYDELINLLYNQIKNKQDLYGDTVLLNNYYKYKTHMLDIRYLGRWIDYNEFTKVFFIDEFGKNKPWNMNVNSNDNMIWHLIFAIILNKNKTLLNKSIKLKKLYDHIITTNIIIKKHIKNFE